MNKEVKFEAAPRCVLVLGMHRSGTSAATRCLNMVGVEVGPNLLVPDGGNSKGYWEHADAVRINDTLLASFGLNWWSLKPLPNGWMDSTAAREARCEIERLVNRDFAAIPLWGIKDPRMCRLAPLWIDVLVGMGIRVSAVFVVRPVLEVARSLAKAHGLSEGASVLSWIQHTAEAEHATRTLPRILVSYDQLLSDPVGVLEQTSASLGLTCPVAPAERRPALEAFVDVGLRTHRREQDNDSLPPLAIRLEAACQQLAEGGGDWSTLSSIVDGALEALSLLDYRASAPLPDELARIHLVALAESERAFAVLKAARNDGEFEPGIGISREIPRGRIRLEFAMEDESYERYQLTPADRAGYYVIHNLVIVNGAGAVVWSWQGASSELAHPGVEPVYSPTVQDGILCRLDEDARITFARPAHLAGLGCRLVLDIERFGEPRIRHELDVFRVRVEEKERGLRAQLEASLAIRGDLMKSIEAMRGEVLESLDVARRTGSDYSAAIHAQLATASATTEALRLEQVRQGHQIRSLLQRGLWARVRRRLARIEFRMLAKQHLEVVNAAERRYRVTDNDPIFECDSANYPLAPGWYHITLDMHQHNGIPVRGCLYPDYGPNVPGDPSGISLPFIRPGQSTHSGVVRFAHAVNTLRFDPATAPCEITVSRLVIRPVTRVRAALELFRAWRKPQQILGKVRPAWRTILDDLQSRGLSSAVAELYRWYSAADESAEAYDSWLAKFDDVSLAAVEAAKVEAGAWDYVPVISVLVPVYNTDELWLRRCLDSVLAQVYPHWELCVADDASPDPRVLAVLDEYAARDSRIHVQRRSENGHISASSNTALNMATGEYVALLDHDDELHPFALQEVVSALQTHRGWKLVYSDEDKLDKLGRRYDPYMKPDWNYDLLLSQNYVCHLGVYQRQLLVDIGGFREGYEGSQDWDLILRCIEKIGPHEIGHIPRVLYHWRAIPGSTAVGVGEKNYARIAGLKAVRDHLERIGAQATVTESASGHGHIHVRYDVPAPCPKVSIIIPTRDGLHLLKRCVDSILDRTDYGNYEILIVDNQSRAEDTLDYFRAVVADPRVRVLAYDQPFNYSALNNYAVRHASGDLIALVNNDIEVISASWLSEMAGHALRAGTGAVGAMLYYPDDTIQHAGVVLGIGGVAGHAYCGEKRGFSGQMGRAQLTQNLSAVTAACLVIRRSIFEEVGGLDEALRVAFNDIDFCLRVRRLGYRNVWTPFAELYHHESATRGYEDSPEKKARFAGEVERMRRLWGDELDSDPAYNPNLTLTAAPFDLAFPPRVATR
jgi:glycosyltransferase involved in cell wall biosynthesis